MHARFRPACHDSHLAFPDHEGGGAAAVPVAHSKDRDQTVYHFFNQKEPSGFLLNGSFLKRTIQKMVSFDDFSSCLEFLVHIVQKERFVAACSTYGFCCGTKYFDSISLHHISFF